MSMKKAFITGQAARYLAELFLSKNYKFFGLVPKFLYPGIRFYEI